MASSELFYLDFIILLMQSDYSFYFKMIWKHSVLIR